MQGSHASWKVIKFEKGISQAWKTMLNDCGYGIPPISHRIFQLKDNYSRMTHKDWLVDNPLLLI